MSLILPPRYQLEGVPIVSVTEALDYAGIRNVGKIYNESQRILRGTIGTAVHKATAYQDINGYLWDTLPMDVRQQWDRVHSEVGKFCWAWDLFKEREHFVPIRVEYRVIVRYGLFYFGMTLDREGLLRNEPYIIDIKTGKKREPWWGPQLAGYTVGMMTLHGMPKVPPYTWKRAVVRLLPEDGKGIPYRWEAFDELSDFEYFKAAVTCANFARLNY